MLCNINGDNFYSFTENTWISDSGASHHITNDDTGLFDITNIYKWIQESSSNMLVPKKGKLCINVHQVDHTKWVYALWPMKGNKISSDHQNNIKVESSQGNIVRLLNQDPQ